MEVTQETFKPLRRALAMFALAKASHMPREELEALTKELPGFSASAVPIDTARRLQERVAKGAVTCIVANPEPFTALQYVGTFGNASCIYGIWAARRASWYGKREAPKRIGVLTREEAIAKGIPMPDESPPIGDGA